MSSAAPIVAMAPGATSSEVAAAASSPSPLASPVFHSNPASPTSVVSPGGGIASGGSATGGAAIALTKTGPAITRTSTQMNSSSIAATVVALKPATPAPPAIVKTGYLTKLGGNILSKWRLRWFLLKENEFIYFDSEKDYNPANPTAKAPLGRMIVDENLHCWSESANSLEWKFVSLEKTVVVRGTLPQKQEWYDAIDQLTAKIIANASMDGKKLMKRPDWTSAGRPPSPSVSRTDDESSLIAAGDPSVEVVDHSNITMDGVGDDMFTAARESTGGMVAPPPPPEVERTRITSPNGTVTTTETSATVTTASVRPLTGDESSVVQNRPSLKVRSESVMVSSGSRSQSSTPRSGGAVMRKSGASFSIAHTTMTPEELARAREKRLLKSKKAQELFGWPESELLLADYSCAIEKSIMLHGRLYVSEHFISFYSSLFGGVKLCIPIVDVISVCEAKQALIFDNAIRIFVRPPSASSSTTRNAADGGRAVGGGVTDAGAAVESSYFFGSFGPGGRDRATQLMTSLINHTYSAADYTLGLELSKSASTNSLSNTTGASATSDSEASQSRIEGIDEEETEDATTSVEEGGEEGAAAAGSEGVGPGGARLTKMSSRLDFGDNRPTMTVAESEAIDFTPMLEETFPTMNARTFWRVFLSDAALYTTEQYHATRGDTEYAASAWKDAKLLDGASTGGWQLVRDTMVRVPVIGSPMGPDSTRVLKVQKQRLLPGPPVVIEVETIAVTPDTPFADCFNLRDIWTIADSPTPGGGCTVKIKFGINIHKSNWKLRAIKSMLVSRATGDNQKGFVLYVAEMKKFVDAHQAEVDAVKKVVAASQASLAGKKAPGGGTPAKKAATVKATTPAPVVTASSSSPVKPAAGPFGPLQPFISKLPPALQSVPAVAGLASAVLLLLVLVVYFAFFSGAAAGVADASSSSSFSSASDPVGHYSPTHADPSDSTSGVSPDQQPPPPQRPPTFVMSGSGTSSVVTCLLTLLLAAVGALAYKVTQLEGDLARLRAEFKKK